MTSDSHIQDLFTHAGLRCTRQRAALYRALSQSRSHPTADDLYRELGGKTGSLSLATVYNTLEAFCRAGIAQRLPAAGGNGSARYDALRDNHLHLRCQKTGQVADVPDQLGDKILRHIPRETLAELEEELGFEISQVQIELIGRYQ